MQQQQTSKQKRFSAAAMVIILMVLLPYAYLVPRGVLSNADSRLALTRAIVEEHRLSIDSYAATLIDRSTYHGHYYTDKAPGISLLAVPSLLLARLVLSPDFFANQSLIFIVRYIVTLLTTILPFALGIALLWPRLSLRVGRRWGALLALSMALGTPLWSVITLFESHGLTALVLGAALFLLLPVLARTVQPTLGRYALIGGLCGFSLCLEYPPALIVAVVALAAGQAIWPLPWKVRLSRLAVYTGALLLAVLPLLIYNTAAFGSPFSQGYAHLGGHIQFIEGMAHGIEGIGWPSLEALWGITFSPYRGLFFLSPFLLAAAPGLWLMWQQARWRSAALLCLVAPILMFGFNSSYYFWDGGASMGPRHLLPCLPFLLVPVAFALRHRRWRRFIAIAIAISLLVVSFCGLTAPAFPEYIPNPLINVAWKTFTKDALVNNWGNTLGLHGPISLLPVVIVESLLALLLWGYLLRRARIPRINSIAANERRAA